MCCYMNIACLDVDYADVVTIGNSEVSDENGVLRTTFA